MKTRQGAGLELLGVDREVGRKTVQTQVSEGAGERGASGRSAESAGGSLQAEGAPRAKSSVGN